MTRQSLTPLVRPLRASVDIAGQTFGRLTVTSLAGVCARRIVHWHCRCECGAPTIADGRKLRAGQTRSCGCWRRDRMTTHGLSSHPDYHVWAGMIARCYNPKQDNYARYGGRGIRVCRRWRRSFAAFLADMGPRLHRGLSLDRLDNNKGYSAENCRWATWAQQAANKRPRQRKAAA